MLSIYFLSALQKAALLTFRTMCSNLLLHFHSYPALSRITLRYLLPFSPLIRSLSRFTHSSVPQRSYHRRPQESATKVQRQYNAAPEGRSFRSLRQSQMLSRYRLFVKASRSRHEMLSMAEAHNMRGLADRGYFSALRTNLLGRTRDSNHTYCYYDVEGMRY